MSRTLMFGLVILWSLVGSSAHALGLGGLHAQSALNQPFVGEIELLDAKPDELDTVKAGLAPAEAFTAAGIERFHFLSRLSFEPAVSARGTPVIRVSSREPIREPFLDFLVELVWPDGRLVREYTVLLDPPGLTERSAPVAVAPATAEPSATTTAEPPTRRRATPASSASPVTPGATPVTADFPMQVGPVRPGDGLLRLARRGQAHGATLEQSALALYRNNQDAFIDGDIHRLRIGRVLTVPSAAELLALDPATAARDLESALRGEETRRSPLTVVPAAKPGEPLDGERPRIAGAASQGARPGAVAPAAPATSLESSETEVSAPTATATAPAETPPAAPETVGQPDASLPGAPDHAAQTGAAGEVTAETESLRSRLRDLETQLIEAQVQLELRDAAVARLQAALPGTDEGRSDVDATKPAADSLAQVSASQDDLAAAAPSDQLAGAPQTPSSSTWHAYLLPIAGLAGVTAIGVLAISWLSARRRRREQEEEAAAELSSVDQTDAVHPAPTPSALAVSRIASGDLLPASQPQSHPRIPTDSNLGAMPAELSALDQLDVETEEADVLSEADIYVAYGRYKEAEDLLRDELLLAPDRHDIRFKLGEVYAGTGNREALRSLMEELKRRGGDRADPAQWRQLGQVVAVIERGGVWDPSALRVPDVDAGPTAAAQMAGGGMVASLDAEPRGLTTIAGAIPTTAAQPAVAREPMIRGLTVTEEGPRGVLSEPRATESAPAASMPRPTAFPLDVDVDLANEVEPIFTLDDLREDSSVSLDELIEPGSAPVLSGQDDLDLALPSLHLPDEEWIAGATEQDLLESLSSVSSPLPKLDAPRVDTTAGEWLADSNIWDENATKLDLARAYLDMEDAQSAREILEEVLADGREEQRREAEALLAIMARA